MASARIEWPADADLPRLKVRAFATGLTTIDSCLKPSPRATFRRREAGIEARAMIVPRGGFPALTRGSRAKFAGVSALDRLVFRAGAFYVVDRGRLDFARCDRIHLAGAFFIPRAKRRRDCRAGRRSPVESGGPVTRDQRTRPRGPESRKRCPDTLRRVRHIDPDTGKRLSFLANHLALEARSIAPRNRERRKIEPRFQWTRQHPHARAYFGTTANAVKTQWRIAATGCVRIHRPQHRHGLRQTPDDIARILGVMIFEKPPINQVFPGIQREDPEDQNRNRATPFEF